MDPNAFILTVGRGEEAAARAALAADASLAASRNEAGISVIALTVYAGRCEFASEMAALRSNLDLFEAACIGNVERVQRLLERDPDAIDRHAPDGFSAIGFAAYFGHIPLLGLLLERGADFEAPSANAMQVRPLHSAAAHRDPPRTVATSRVLLEAGADPNAQRQGGFTPLHEAVLTGNAKLARLLLAHGANPHLSDDEGDSPLQLAHTGLHPELIALLDETLTHLH
jgi:ankyrin repeat protein